MSTYGFAHANVKKSIFKSKILEFVDNMDIISNVFLCLFYWTIWIWVKFIWVENPKIPGIQPIYYETLSFRQYNAFSQNIFL